METIVKGYRTIIFNAAMLIAGITGAAITPEMGEEFAAAVLTISGVVNLVLRTVTNTAIFDKGA